MLNRLRDRLNQRGAHTIRGLSRTFRILEGYDGKRKVDGQELLTGLTELGVQITKPEADVITFFFLSECILARLYLHISTPKVTGVLTLTSSWSASE